MSSDLKSQPASANIVWHHATVTRMRREAQNGHRGAIIWFTGLSGSGKSTLAHAVEESLYQRGCKTFVLDGDNVRHACVLTWAFQRKTGKKTSVASAKWPNALWKQG